MSDVQLLGALSWCPAEGHSCVGRYAAISSHKINILLYVVRVGWVGLPCYILVVMNRVQRCVEHKFGADLWWEGGPCLVLCFV